MLVPTAERIRLSDRKTYNPERSGKLRIWLTIEAIAEIHPLNLGR